MRRVNDIPFAKLTNEIVPPAPLSFDNVLYFNFIIKCNMGKLRNVCKEWFNLPTNFEKVYEPIMPYVMVSMAYNPRSYSDSWKEAKPNKGFMPYKELIYTVFLKEKREFGLLESIGLQKPLYYAFVPFLFLDNAKAVCAGREMFGMAKVMAALKYPQLGDTGPGQSFKVTSLGFDKSHIQAPLAKEQLIMEVKCPDNFNIEEIITSANGDPEDAISREFYRNVESDGVIDINLASMMVKVNQLNNLNLRQHRDVFRPKEAISKSIIEFPSENLTITNGGLLPGPYEIIHGENSLTYPVQEMLGMESKPTIAAWMQYNFKMVNGKKVWE